MKGIRRLLIGIGIIGILGYEASQHCSFSTVPFPVFNIDHLISFLTAQPQSANLPLKPINEIKTDLPRLAPNLNPKAVDTVITTLQCADKNSVEHNHILAVIDYSLPSNQKRLWVFDLSKDKLLFNTYVSHGIQSGALLSTYFSNKYNGKASSIGVFNTDKIYRGRHGSSLKLLGLDRSFNDNAYNRFIVMHGAWYVEEWFIKKYGRPGRSWGCPVLPLHQTSAIIDAIKDRSLLVVYYPDSEWLAKSKFLHCEMTANTSFKAPEKPPETQREAILFLDLNHNGKREENEPVVTITADNYKNLFNKTVPLERMLRRQINQIEYVALTNTELKQVIASNNSQSIYFIIPVVTMQRGYYVTEMKILPFGRISKITANSAGNYTIYFENKSPGELRADDRFIRWVGL